MPTNQGRPSVMNVPPFDAFGDIRKQLVLVDDFIGGSLVDGAIGELSWDLVTIAGDSVPAVTNQAGLANNPGIIRLQTGATTPAAGDSGALALGTGRDQLLISSANGGVYAAFVVRIPTALTGVELRVGLRDDVTASRPNSGIVVEYDNSADADDFVSYCAQGGVGAAVTAPAAVAAPAADSFFVVEIGLTYTNAWTYVNGEPLANHTTNIPTDTLVPVLTLTAEGAAEEFADIDAFALRMVLDRFGY